MKLLDDTWEPGSNDVVDKYTFFSPLSTSTFNSLIASKASKETRTFLYTQVLEGIAFLHEKGITHRDIKPANLLVQSYDPPLAKVTDFGSATAKKTILYDWPGTIPYLAPE
jgi:serine/threonine protein kinase